MNITKIKSKVLRASSLIYLSFAILCACFLILKPVEALAQVCDEQDEVSLFERKVVSDSAAGNRVTLLQAILTSGVNEPALQKAFRWFESNKDKIKNRKYLTMVDYSKSSSEDRLYLVNLCNGTFRKFQVAHGLGSDYSHSGYAQRFSNSEGSNASSLGFYLTDEIYYSESFGTKALRLIGLSATNSNAYERSIVVHGAGYVTQEYGACGDSDCAMRRFRQNRISYLDPETKELVQENKIDFNFDYFVKTGRVDWRKVEVKGVLLGRSNGCVAVHPVTAEYMIARVNSGSVLYSFYGSPP
ncbi:MAG: murein L,D-transpeptidase catalytic domain-containing protein [Pseudobdellovibrionaceae bacterium]